MYLCILNEYSFSVPPLMKGQEVALKHRYNKEVVFHKSFMSLLREFFCPTGAVWMRQNTRKCFHWSNGEELHNEHK